MNTNQKVKLDLSEFSGEALKLLFERERNETANTYQYPVTVKIGAHGWPCVSSSSSSSS